MRIGVISDSHGDKKAMDKAVKLLIGCDLIYHLGDNFKDIQYLKKEIQVPIRGVRGNCDIQGNYPLDLIDEVSGIRVLLTHGHKWDVQYNIFKLRYKALETNSKLILYGHTHVGKIEEEDGIYYINPGSISEARGGSNRSLAIIELNESKITPVLVSL